MSEKRALVTGASEGIGQAFAEALATEGYQVTLVARSQERLQAARARLSGAGHEVLVADLSTPAGIERVAAELAGGYTLLINNAGVGSHGAFAATDLAQLQAMMRLNCDAVMQLSHAFLRGSKKGDALINVASVLGLLGMPQVAGLYAATKAFVISLSENLWFEHKARGVFVMALCPGATATRFHEHSGASADSQPPPELTQPAAEVVAEALRALQARSGPVLVTGFRNGVMSFASRLLSHRAKINVMASLTSRRKKEPEPDA